MILAIDIGNTNIVLGCIDSTQIYFTERLSTVRSKTALEYAIAIKEMLTIYGIDSTAIDGGIVSSVVPQLTNTVRQAAQKILKKDILVMSPDIKTGITVRTDKPQEVGSDLIAGIAAAIAAYPLPAIVIDMGTATTISIVDTDETFIGCLILPGVRTSFDSLTSQASQLHSIAIEEPGSIIATNTKDCMLSGIMYSNAAAIDGIADRIEEELGQTVSIIATGGLAKQIIRLCKRTIILDEELLLKGLWIIYNKNQHC